MIVQDAPAAPAPTLLTWRQPAPVWFVLVLALSVAWPLLFLRNEGGWAQLAAICVAVALLVSLGSISAAAALGRPARQRRHVVIHVLAASGLAALLAPFAFTGLVGLLAGVERGDGSSGFEIAGVSPDMAWALAPLALAVGAPCALVAGLALSLIAFRKTLAPQDGVLIATRADARALTDEGRADRGV